MQRIRSQRAVALGVFVGVFAIAALTWMGARVYLQIASIRNSPRTFSSLVLKQIERLKPYTKFIYADEPIYSFHAGIPMPPNLAVMPLKRLWAGDMTNARIAAEMREVKPELILLRTDRGETPFGDLITAEYRPIYEDASHRLYVKKSLAKRAGY